MKKGAEQKQKIQQRVENIKQMIRFTNDCYYDYERKTLSGVIVTPNDLIELINRIEGFNKTQYEDVQVSRFGYEPVPVYYFEGFKTAYPKQYKQIVKDMKKEKISPEYLVKQLPVLNEKLAKFEKEATDAKNKETAKKFLKQKTQELAKVQAQDMAL